MPAAAREVTFLFTDVAGSTALWELAPDEMGAALAVHDRLFEDMVSTSGGTVVRPRGEGDSRFAVFDDAAAAAGAAAGFCRRLVAQEWATPTPIEARVAIHTGSAQLREGDWYGSDVNRCARLRAIGHPGQILASAAAVRAAGDKPLDDSAWLDLGSHRLKDLLVPEHVFQLGLPDLETEFPPLRSLDASPHNLPFALTSFLGRAEELRDVVERVASSRLVTLVGAGGSGKTRLALQSASELTDEFVDGVRFVELAPVAEGERVGLGVARGVGVRQEPNKTILATLVEYLSEKRLLVLLDNCEHVLDPTAALVDGLLRSCRNVAVLATSREPLLVDGEVILRLRSMPGDEAVELFVARVAHHLPSFEPGAAERAIIADICGRLDGIPLAVELAAARARAMPLAEIAVRLDDRFRILAGSSRSALPRHKTMHAAIDWSYQLLDEDERRVLRRSSVMADGGRLEALEAVVDFGDLGMPAFELISALVDKSLMNADPDGRYRLLETIRQFAENELAHDGEATAARNRHLRWFVDGCTGLFERLVSEPDTSWDALRADWENYRSAVGWAMATGGGDAAAEIVWGLFVIWEEDLLLGDLALARTVLERSPPTSPRNRARLTCVAGDHEHLIGDEERAVELLRTGIDELRMLGEDFERTWALGLLGQSLNAAGDGAGALAVNREARSIARALGEDLLELNAEYWICTSLAIVGDHAAARDSLEQVLLRVPESWPEARRNTLLAISDSAAALGDTDRVEEASLDALALTPVSVAWPRARALLGLAAASAARGQAERAAVLLGVVDRLLASQETPLGAKEANRREQLTQQSVEVLGKTGYERAFERGAAMDEAGIEAFAGDPGRI